jgi:hypothetical protein
LVDLSILTRVNGYPTLPESRKGPLGMEQMNFPILPSQKDIIEKALDLAKKQMRKDKVKVKESNGNAITKICSEYIDKIKNLQR